MTRYNSWQTSRESWQRLFILTAAVLSLVISVVGKGAEGATVKTGIDNLLDTDFRIIKGRKIALLTHAAARTRQGESSFDVVRKRSDIALVRVFSPEHGFHGTVTAGVKVENDTILGVEVRSLYGQYRRPTHDMLTGVETVVIDLQDIGCRSYTYVSTMIEMLTVCAELDIDVFVLDRPNPLGGSTVDGRTVDSSVQSFVGRIPIAYVHGMTLGELATMANGEGWLGRDSSGIPRRVNLTVIKAKRWSRTMRWEETGLDWYPTSPNIPTIAAARAYPITGIIGELSTMSIGIGSALPFSILGAPGLAYDSALVSAGRRHGILLRDIQFTPATGRFARTTCTGYHVEWARVDSIRPVRFAMFVLHRLSATYPDIIPDSLSPATESMITKVTGSSQLLPMLRRKASFDEVDREMSVGLSEFLQKRKKYLLYD